MHTRSRNTLGILLVIYAAASLAHFAHNAHFLADYPNLPANWSAAGVYGAWLGVTLVGVTGWLLLARGHDIVGLLALILYAFAGLDSLGHYVVASFTDHTAIMNGSILFEVVTAALVLIEVVRQLALRLVRARSGT